MKVYMLDHVHEFEDGHEDVKLIGIYSSREKAEAALASVKEQPGFIESPECFSISEINVDQDHWREGFVTVD